MIFRETDYSMANQKRQYLTCMILKKMHDNICGRLKRAHRFAIKPLDKHWNRPESPDISRACGLFGVVPMGDGMTVTSR